MEPKQKRQISEETRLKNNARTKAWREAHKDYMKEYNKNYRQENGEELKAANREYHAVNREERNAYRRQWSVDNKEREREGRRRWYQENKDGKYLDSSLRSKYGIGLEQYNELLALQGGGCAICPKVDVGSGDTSGGRRLHVDHDRTGRVRGLLCHFHNTAIGSFEEEPEQLQRVIAYLTPSSSVIDGHD